MAAFLAHPYGIVLLAFLHPELLAQAAYTSPHPSHDAYTQREELRMLHARKALLPQLAEDAYTPPIVAARECALIRRITARSTAEARACCVHARQ